MTDLKVVRLGKEKNKGGRPSKYEKPRKARQVYADDDQIEYLRWWLKHKGQVPKKPWKL